MFTNFDGALIEEPLSRARASSAQLWREVENAIGDDPPDGDAERLDRVLPLKLSGRAQIDAGPEFACNVEALSILGLGVTDRREVELGARCSANILSLGVIEGVVTAIYENGFVIGPIADGERIWRLADRLSWHLRQRREGGHERRASERIELRRVAAVLESEDGDAFSCQILDISEGGAALRVDGDALYFWIDQYVRIDGRSGRVLRLFPGGLVVKFE